MSALCASAHLYILLKRIFHILFGTKLNTKYAQNRPLVETQTGGLLYKDIASFFKEV